MDHLLKNKTTRTPQYYRESYAFLKKMGNKNPWRMFVGLILVWVCEIYFIVESISESYVMSYIFAVLYLPIAIKATLTVCFSTKLYVKSQIKQDIKRYKAKESYSEFYFYGDHFQQCSAYSKSRSIVYYSDIIKLEQTQHYYLLITRSNYVFIVDKATTQNASAEDFLVFLQSKLASHQ